MCLHQSGYFGSGYDLALWYTRAITPVSLQPAELSNSALFPFLF